MAGKARLLLADRDAGQGGSVSPFPLEDSYVVPAWAAHPSGLRQCSTAPQRKEACGKKSWTKQVLHAPSMTFLWQWVGTTAGDKRGFSVLSRDGDEKEVWATFSFGRLRAQELSRKLSQWRHLPNALVPSFAEVLRVPKPWDASSRSLSGSFALRSSSISFICFSLIFSWADLEMVTWTWHKVKEMSVNLENPTSLSTLSFI